MPGKTLVLIGGGHAHLQVLHALAGTQVRLILISDVLFVPYSGMLPGFISGDYEEQELVFDLANICQRYNYVFIHQAVASIEASKKQVRLSDGTVIDFDFCSLNVGIVPQPIGVVSTNETVIYVKPISEFLEKWRRVSGAFSMKRVVVVGGGAAAFELAVACAVKVSRDVTLILGERGFSLPDGAEIPVRDALAELDVKIVEGERVSKIKETGIITADQKLPFDLCLIATTAQAPAIITNSSLPLSPSGYIQTDEYLRVVGHSNVFAAGDCITFSDESLAKAGVFAVRQGPVLAVNLLRVIRGESNLKKYRPQKNYLSILVSGERMAILCWRGFVLRSRFCWWLKRLIDKKFMRRFA